MFAASPDTAVVAGVVDRRRLLQHQLGQLQLDLDLRQRMGDALVGADRHVPYLALLGVGGGLVEGVAGVADAPGGGHDPLGVEPGEQLPQGGVGILTDECVGGQADVVEEQLELPVGHRDVHLDRRELEAG